MSDIVIRSARLTDLEAIEALERAVFVGDRLSRRSLRAFIRAPHRPVIVAIADERLAGYALVVLRRGSRRARLYSIAVAPHLSRRGVGRALLAACEAYVVRQGGHVLRLEARADNVGAIALYERQGYRRFGYYDDYYDDGATALRMEKELTSS